MIQTQNIHSLTDFQRNTSAHIKRLKESGLPEVLTVNGRAELVLQTAEVYQAMMNRLELYESAAAVTRGLQEIKDGRSKTIDDFDMGMRGKLACVEKGA
jgi:PHD/YefM family antitoxin component YafN of YafNO toxin-antitoxin module